MQLKKYQFKKNTLGLYPCPNKKCNDEWCSIEVNGENINVHCKKCGSRGPTGKDMKMVINDWNEMPRYIPIEEAKIALGSYTMSFYNVSKFHNVEVFSNEEMDNRNIILSYMAG